MTMIEGQLGIWECSRCGGMHEHPLYQCEWLEPRDREPKPFDERAVRHNWACEGCMQQLQDSNRFVPVSADRPRDLLTGRIVVTETDTECCCRKR
jgi:ribosomal protein L37AE/L43A